MIKGIEGTAPSQADIDSAVRGMAANVENVASITKTIDTIQVTGGSPRTDEPAGVTFTDSSGAGFAGSIGAAALARAEDDSGLFSSGVGQYIALLIAGTTFGGWIVTGVLNGLTVWGVSFKFSETFLATIGNLATIVVGAALASRGPDVIGRVRAKRGKTP
jgi:hypothetical protein